MTEQSQIRTSASGVYLLAMFTDGMIYQYENGQTKEPTDAPDMTRRDGRLMTSP